MGGNEDNAAELIGMEVRAQDGVSAIRKTVGDLG